MRDMQGALAVIRHAIQNEITGQRFYGDAARYCIDLWAKEIFANLARDEEMHTRLLLVEYEALTTRGRWIDPDEAMASGADVDVTRLTFPEGESKAAGELFPAQWSTAQAVDRTADDLSALAFGIKMERRAIALYGGEAKATGEPAAQKAYEFLLTEETRHLEELKAHWEMLAGRAFEGDGD